MAMIALKADTTNVLPQEIVNLIVDEVLRLKPVSQSRATLRACSLVSRSFAVQSRPYLWSNLEFRLDNAYQKRASKLLRMLKHHTDSRNLVSGVRSVNFVYDVPTPEDWVPVEPPLGRLGPIKKFFRQRKNYIHDLLNILNHPDLHHLGVETRGPSESFLEWAQIKHSIEPIIMQMLSSKNLKAFTLYNLNRVSLALILAACFSSAVEDLTIRNVTFLYDPFWSLVDSVTPIPTQLRRLELRPSLRVDAEMFTFFLFFPSPPSSSSSMSAHPLFPHLQTLVVSIPYWTKDMDSLWRFMTAVAPTLETLDMEYRNRGYAIASVLPLSLCRLIALRHFKFRIIAPDDTPATLLSQDVLLSLLASPNTTPKLGSIELRYLFLPTNYTPSYHTEGTMSLRTWKGAPHWSTIDSHIADEEFPCLKSVTISVEERYQLDTCGEGHIAHMSTEETRFRYPLGDMFPRLSGNPDINFFAEGQIVIWPLWETLGSSTSSIHFDD